MRQVAGRPLWLGHAGDLRDPRAALAAGVEAVVELADSEPPAALPRGLVRCRFPLSDGGANPPWLLRLAAESVAALVRAADFACRGGPGVPSTPEAAGTSRGPGANHPRVRPAEAR